MERWGHDLPYLELICISWDKRYPWSVKISIGVLKSFVYGKTLLHLQRFFQLLSCHGGLEVEIIPERSVFFTPPLAELAIEKRL